MNPQRCRAPVGLILGAVAALTPIRAASPLQGHVGHMDMQMDASGPAPAICQLLGSRPVVIPTTLANARNVAPFLRVTDARSLGELVIEVGPVDIPARGMPAESRQLVYQLTRFPLDAWVHGFRLELTDARGRPVPRSVLHHIDTTRPAARDLFLPVAQRFVALGSETGSQNLPGWLADRKSVV